MTGLNLQPEIGDGNISLPSGSEDLASSSSAPETNSSTGSTSNQSGNSEEEVKKIQETLSKKESQDVFRLRVLVILILFSAATAISATVFFLTRNAEKEDFETQYFGVAEKIIQAFQDVMIEMSAVSGLAVAETSDSNSDSNNAHEWPFVTLSNFQERAGNARELSGAIYVSINPIVQAHELAAWEKYVLRSKSWIDEGLRYQQELGINNFSDAIIIDRSWLTYSEVDPLHTFDPSGWSVLSNSNGPFLPRWQTSPVLLTSMVNENLLEKPHISALAQDCIDSKSAILGGFVTAPPGSTSHPNPETGLFATLLSMWRGEKVNYEGDPIAHLTIPIFDTFHGTELNVVGVMQSTVHWQSYLTDVLPSTVHGITVVIENSCDGAFTYEMDGDRASIVGKGNQHDPTFHEYEVQGKFTNEHIKDGTVHGIRLNQDGCPYTFLVYPTQQYYEQFITSDPVVICASVAIVFAFTILMFFAYDWLVERRQKLVLAKATQSTAIVSSLFPKQIRDRLLAIQDDKAKRNAMLAPNHKLKTYLNGTGDDANSSGTQPIADLFPNCTVFFADIAGFTAWSSTREPAQVFILLQTLYQSFDMMAKRRRVFKVETIGDSYVAVTGLPEPQPRHAVIMAKFSWDCLVNVANITKSLEVQLGPGTGDLHMRFGLHSGPVTAGVLQGDRARFQLFGDTVNTAARLESTGRKGRIQISNATADCLKAAGKEQWFTAREDSVEAKGKGVLDTYWLALSNTMNTASQVSGSDCNPVEPSLHLKIAHEDSKVGRLVEWIADILLENVKKIVVVRKLSEKSITDPGAMHYTEVDGKICLDEVQEVITMPHFDAKVALAAHDSNSVSVPLEVVSQLREYVDLVARSYGDNPFHNFEHACHVTMSVNKLISRVVTPDLEAQDDSIQEEKATQEMAAQIHVFTHGLTSDPMAVFALTFSALIHDVDHQGISNAQLIKEEPEMGEHYRNKSVAEQNSLDVSWDLLMGDQFDEMRRYIFGEQEELMRFRQLIVNIVLATDIFDKELNDLRKSRWERAFHDRSIDAALVSDYRATVVMEHIIQASDVSHTMQHWHVYQKWNVKLFTELHTAYEMGRMKANPADFWYQGELAFFDNYIIPLAKKLKECNVFGVSSDEYLNYALMNRAEWKERGEELVKDLVQGLAEAARTSCTNRTTRKNLLNQPVESLGILFQGSEHATS